MALQRHLSTFSLIAGLFQHMINGTIFNSCDNWYECYQDTMTCSDDEDCYVYCSGNYACYKATINCPANANCYIHCTDSDSCRESTIHASSNLYADCTATESCRDSFINGAADSTLNVTCTGSSEACKGTVITGAENTDMNVVCGDYAACYQATIDGREAEILRVLDCATSTYTCIGTEFYCPPNVNGEKRCIIQGLWFNLWIKYLNYVQSELMSMDRG